MSRFYVGQRVRIKYARTDEGRRCVGKQASIVGVLDDGRFRLEVDGVKGPNRGKWRACGDQLEPITDSYDKTTWDECAWKPSHLRDVVKA